MKSLTFLIRSSFLFFATLQAALVYSQRKTIDQKADSVLKLMTLNEKIGQMNQYSGVWAHTGPITEEGNMLQQIKEGKLGSMLNINGVAHTRELQQLAGLLPICSYCKRIRDDAEKWSSLEGYIEKRSEAQFSHGICPDCYKKHVEPQLGGR